MECVKVLSQIYVCQTCVFVFVTEDSFQTFELQNLVMLLIFFSFSSFKFFQLLFGFCQLCLSFLFPFLLKLFHTDII